MKGISEEQRLRDYDLDALKSLLAAGVSSLLMLAQAVQAEEPKGYIASCRWTDQVMQISGLDLPQIREIQIVRPTQNEADEELARELKEMVGVEKCSDIPLPKVVTVIPQEERQKAPAKKPKRPQKRIHLDPFAAAIQAPPRHLVSGALGRLSKADPEVEAYREDPGAGAAWRLVSKAGLRVPFLANPVPKTSGLPSVGSAELT
jgi:hypothetical protein